MPKRILISGAPGAGKTTIGKELARKLNYKHIEIDDYNWRLDAEVPYTIARPIEESHEHLLNDIVKSPQLVVSGSMWIGRERFTPFFDLAIFINAPAEIRVDRLRSRQLSLHKERVLEGGDMYEGNNRFLESAASYDMNYRKTQHDLWKSEMSCPVIYADGTESISDIVEWMTKQCLAVFSIE